MDVYLVNISEDLQFIIVKTTNKKYYKKIDIPDLKRINILLSKEHLSWVFKNNTLIITVIYILNNNCKIIINKLISYSPLY